MDVAEVQDLATPMDVSSEKSSSETSANGMTKVWEGDLFINRGTDYAFVTRFEGYMKEENKDLVAEWPDAMKVGTLSSLMAKRYREILYVGKWHSLTFKRKHDHWFLRKLCKTEDCAIVRIRSQLILFYFSAKKSCKLNGFLLPLAQVHAFMWDRKISGMLQVDNQQHQEALRSALPGLQEPAGTSQLGQLGNQTHVNRNLVDFTLLHQQLSASSSAGKRVSFWKGALYGSLSPGKPIFICALEGYTTAASSENVVRFTTNWPLVMHVAGVVDSQIEKLVTGKADYLVFRPMKVKGRIRTSFFDSLNLKNGRAVVKLPSQTLYLAVSRHVDGIWLKGMLFHGNDDGLWLFDLGKQKRSETLSATIRHSSPSEANQDQLISMEPGEVGALESPAC